MIAALSIVLTLSLGRRVGKAARLGDAALIALAAILPTLFHVADT
jgi:hypothetical protein